MPREPLTTPRMGAEVLPISRFEFSPSALDRAWAAGLFEGEGSFGIRRNGTVLLTLASTDKDIVDRFRATIGTGRISSQPPGKNGRRKRLWRVDVIQVDDVLQVIDYLYPWLGSRRRERADEAIRTRFCSRRCERRFHWRRRWVYERERKQAA